MHESALKHIPPYYLFIIVFVVSIFNNIQFKINDETYIALGTTIFLFKIFSKPKVRKL